MEFLFSSLDLRCRPHAKRILRVDGAFSSCWERPAPLRVRRGGVLLDCKRAFVGYPVVTLPKLLLYLHFTTVFLFFGGLGIRGTLSEARHSERTCAERDTGV
jgi:hypothetical protein